MEKMMPRISEQNGLAAATAAMVALIVASNILVQYPINDWLTWGALTYPICFLVTDLSNRAYGASAARRVVYFGFAAGVFLSAFMAGPRIALASGSAFLIAQLLDVAVFDRLRRAAWWRAPLTSSLLASAVDTAVFFSLAFAFTPVPWVTLGIGDYMVKATLALIMLIPFRLFMPVLGAVEQKS